MIVPTSHIESDFESNSGNVLFSSGSFRTMNLALLGPLCRGHEREALTERSSAELDRVRGHPPDLDALSIREQFSMRPQVSTGRSTGAHLHYEVRRQGRPVNPMRFLKVRGPGELFGFAQTSGRARS